MRPQGRGEMLSLFLTRKSDECKHKDRELITIRYEFLGEICSLLCYSWWFFSSSSLLAPSSLPPPPLSSFLLLPSSSPSFFFSSVMRFVLRASCLLGRNSTSWAKPPAPVLFLTSVYSGVRWADPYRCPHATRVARWSRQAEGCYGAQLTDASVSVGRKPMVRWCRPGATDLEKCLEICQQGQKSQTSICIHSGPLFTHKKESCHL
jgi:hypothetical protein